MKDYFASAASYYAQYRPFYPESLVADIVDCFGLNRQERVIDIGSGTGQLAIQIAKMTQEVVAVEVDGEMIAEGRKLCQRHAVENIRWVQSAAEELSITPDLGRFKLATFRFFSLDGAGDASSFSRHRHRAGWRNCRHWIERSNVKVIITITYAQHRKTLSRPT